MSVKEQNLSYARLVELLDYSSDSGLFVWRDGRRRGVVGKVAGTKMTHGHIAITLDRNNFYAHRLAWFYMYRKWPPKFIDHKNGVRDDNRISNLRLATRDINSQNQRRAQRNNREGLLGVVRVKTDKVWRSRPYRAYITTAKKRYTLGYFATAEEASAAYLKAKREMHEGCTI